MNAEPNYIPFLLDTVYIIQSKDTNKSVEKQPAFNEDKKNSTDKQKVNVQMGNYEKTILITTDVELNEKTKVLLLKIFEAVNLHIKDILVTTSPIRLKSLVNYNVEKPAVMIHFTNDESVKYEFIHQKNTHILYSDSLETLTTSSSLKAKLWEAIKTSILPKIRPKENV